MLYRDDLAYIHHAGFSEFAESAAPWIVELLRRYNLRTVVELGCGSGILARELTRAGFDVHGFDISPSMIALAGETAPNARFDVGSFDEIDIPPCDAIIATGEVLNYGTFDGVRRLVASAPASLLLFDVAERGAYPPYDEHRSGGDDWSVIAIKESDGRTLTRRVLTFRAGGRRDEEVHTLELYDRAELLALLRAHGFRTTVRRSYGTRRLPKRHAVYVALR
ncbi:MAG TPA: class I SAM-dependent methyltransferase [Thermoanaerobaculia bacterium]|nr:class I SAM-dependent methyltransferase [Thermoanaerobaculia bacterium]